MDILSARKKAARAKKKPKVKAEQVPQTPAEEASGLSAASAGLAPMAAEADAPVVPRSAVKSEETVVAPEPPSGGENIEAPPNEIEMLAFLLGSEEYAIMIEHVREVIKVWEITPIPNAPPHIIGVTSLRGAVLPVVNIMKRLGLPESGRGDKTRIIIASLDEEETGFIVDRVTGVVRFLPDDIRPVPDTVEQGAGAEFLRGIVRKNDRLYILLDIEKALGK